MPAVAASILTGLLPLSHGVCDNGIDLDPAVGETGFARRLAASGYRSAFIGKAHFSTKGTFAPTGSPECQYSSKDFGDDWMGPYMGFDHAELMCFGHFHKKRNPMMPPSGQHFERWYYGHGERDGQEVWELWGTELPPSTGAAQTWHSALPAAWHTSTWVGDRTVDFLRRARDKGATIPSCCGRPSPTRITRSTAPNRGAGCIIRTRWTSRPPTRWIWTGGRGGTGPRSKASRT